MTSRPNGHRRNTVAGRTSPNGRMIALAPSHNGHVWVLCRCGGESLIRLPAFFQAGKRGCAYCADRVPIGDVRSLIRCGLSIEATARRLCRDATSIRRAMRKHGIAPVHAYGQAKGTQSSTETRRRAVELANTYSARYAAEQIGVSERTIVRWRNGHLARQAPAWARRCSLKR